MPQPLLHLGRYLWRQFMPLVLIIGLLVLPQPPLVKTLWAVAAAFMFAMHCISDRWVWRLAWRFSRYKTYRTESVVLHYAPESTGSWDLPVLLARIEADLSRLTEKFGFSIRRPVVVYLVPSHRELRTNRGRAGGFALWLANAIVVAEDTNLREALPHELTHLFEARWNVMAPPLLCEGLATWAQESFDGLPLDAAVRPHLRNRGIRFESLLSWSSFYSEPHRHARYVMAGSFTGFLIRRFGWKQYRSLYKCAYRFRFRRQFRDAFGMTLKEAEVRWRNELLAREVLNRRLKSGLAS